VLLWKGGGVKTREYRGVFELAAEYEEQVEAWYRADTERAEAQAEINRIEEDAVLLHGERWQAAFNRAIERAQARRGR
jgi:hypothetical protein